MLAGFSATASLRILRTHAYDTLSEQEHGQIAAWLEADKLTDFLSVG